MVNATDPDQGTGGSVLFSFQPPSPFFAIDGARGTITVTRALDYETTSAYQLTVNATVCVYAHTHTHTLHTLCLLYTLTHTHSLSKVVVPVPQVPPVLPVLDVSLVQHT